MRSIRIILETDKSQMSKTRFYKRKAPTIAFWHPGTSNNWKCLNVLVLEVSALAKVKNLTFEVFLLLLFLQDSALALHNVRHVLLVLVARLIITVVIILSITMIVTEVSHLSFACGTFSIFRQ